MFCILLPIVLAQSYVARVESRGLFIGWQRAAVDWEWAG